MTVTGPSKPEGRSGELALYGFTVVNATFVAPACSSPMRRLTQAFTTSILISFAPGFSAEVTSTRYGACQTCSSFLPLTVTTARFFTSPRSIQSREPFLNQSGDVCTAFVYVPTPEKY